MAVTAPNATLPARDIYERNLAMRLVAAGKLDGGAMERVLRLSGANDRIEDVLTRLGLVQERDVTQAAADELGLPLAMPDDFPDSPVFDEASPKFLRKMRVLPIRSEPDAIVLAMADPLHAFAAQSIAFLAGKPVSIRVAAASDLDIALDRLYGGDKDDGGEIIDDLAGTDDLGLDEDVGRLRDLASEAPVIRLVNSIIARAVESRASDIHIEPCVDRLRIRYRVDGALREVQSPPSRLRAAVASRIKIMAKLNIAERRLPQDGRIRIAVRGKDYDLRVATVPQLHGEAITMRVLDRESLVADFTTLGFAPDSLERYLSLLHKPEGIVLVTGPTGSGKTTTLYTSLQRLNRPERKIFTVEDPVEYQLDGINQIQVKPQIGLTFPEVLRTLLRHNPNIIMVGEMRDLETAQIAIQAALTGHLVLSTLHTNGAAGSITRLLDMKVEDYLVTSTLAGVTAQRLVRRLCPECRKPRRIMAELAERMGMPASPDGADTILYEPGGCPACHGSGYHGQIALIEVLVITDEIRRLVLKRAEALDIHRAAVAEGMRTMYRDGVLKALAGMTTIEEILRVTRDM